MKNENLYDDVDIAVKTLLDWIDTKKNYLGPNQVAAIMISIASTLAYDTSSSKEEANNLIQNSLNAGWNDHLREKENE